MSFKDNFINFQNLETDDYLLRQVNPEIDFEEYCKIYSDSEVMKYYGNGTTTSEKEKVLRILNNQIKEFETARIYSWTIVDKISKKTIGRILLSDFESENRIANIGYFITRDYWRRGIITACIKTVINFGFSILKLERIYTTVHVENIGSWKALEKNGFLREGLLRHCFNIKSGLCDCYIYAKLSTDQ